MKKLILVFVIVSLHVSAEAEKIRPGLWQLTTTVKGTDGKEVNVLKSMVDKVNSAKPSQKKEFEASLKAMHIVNLETDPASQVCYTEKDIENLRDAMSKMNQRQECQASNVVDTGTEVKASIKCKDGSSGTVLLKYSDSSFEHVVDMASKKSKSTMVSKGVFLAAECGDVRPHSK